MIANAMKDEIAMLARAARYVAAAALLLLSACAGSPPDTPPDAGPDAGSGCAPGELALDGGACQPAGVPDGAAPCPPGEAPLDGGSCQPAGVPADACEEGFVFKDDICEPVLPPTSCLAGTMAVPGETSCHEVAPCGAGVYPSVPAGATVVYVDASYVGVSNGMAATPWTGVQEAINTAPNDAIIAIAEGIYPENVSVSGKTVHLLGLCPEKVEIVGQGKPSATLFIGKGANGSEIRGIAIQGPTTGLTLSGSKGVVLDQLWIHGTLGRGVDIEDTLGASEATMTHSLVEGASDLGVYVSGSHVTLDGSVVRSTKPVSGKGGRGLSIRQKDTEGTRANVTIRRSVVTGNTDAGIRVLDADVDIVGSVVSDTLPLAGSALVTGIGVGAQRFADDGPGEGPIVKIRGSSIERNTMAGVHAARATVMLDASVVRDTKGVAGAAGAGIWGEDGLPSGVPAALTLTRCVVQGNVDVGVSLLGSKATLSSTIVRDNKPALDGASGWGLRVFNDRDTGTRSTLGLAGSVVAHNVGEGVFMRASDATIESSVVRDTQLQAVTKRFGRGVVFNYDHVHGGASTGTVRASLIADNYSCGIDVTGSTALVEATAVKGTKPEDGGSAASGVRAAIALPDSPTAGRLFTPASATVLFSLIEGIQGEGIIAVGAHVDLLGSIVRGGSTADSRFGDGVIVLGLSFADARAHVVGSRVESNQRAGLAAFGGALEIGGTVLQCNMLDMEIEDSFSRTSSIDKLANNVCGCPDAGGECHAYTGKVAPPVLKAPVMGGPTGCENSGDCGTCIQCSTTEGACKPIADACLGDPECLAYGDCVGACPLDDPSTPTDESVACISNASPPGCKQQHPSGIAPYDALADCVECTACTAVCDFVDLCK